MSLALSVFLVKMGLENFLTLVADFERWFLDNGWFMLAEFFDQSLFWVLVDKGTNFVLQG